MMEDVNVKLNPGLRQQNHCSFHQENGFKFKEETTIVLHLEESFMWCCNLYMSGSSSEIPGKF